MKKMDEQQIQRMVECEIEKTIGKKVEAIGENVMASEKGRKNGQKWIKIRDKVGKKMDKT